MSQLAGRLFDGDDPRHGNGDGGQRERGEQAPNQATQELLQNQSTTCPRNLLPKLIHDRLLACEVRDWTDRYGLYRGQIVQVTLGKSRMRDAWMSGQADCGLNSARGFDRLCDSGIRCVDASCDAIQWSFMDRL